MELGKIKNTCVWINFMRRRVIFYLKLEKRKELRPGYCKLEEGRKVAVVFIKRVLSHSLNLFT